MSYFSVASNITPARGGPTIVVTPLNRDKSPNAEVRLSKPRRSTNTENMIIKRKFLLQSKRYWYLPIEVKEL